jgi:hypothetical protein
MESPHPPTPSPHLGEGGRSTKRVFLQFLMVEPYEMKTTGKLSAREVPEAFVQVVSIAQGFQHRTTFAHGYYAHRASWNI